MNPITIAMLLVTAGLISRPISRIQDALFQQFQLAQQAPAAVLKQEDRFQLAQRNLADAVSNLQAYLRVSPQGKDTALARMQLAAITNMRPGDVPPAPVYLASYLQKIQWYVDKVQRSKDATLVTLKIINLSPDQDCQFRAFTTSPLVLIGDDREIYTMTKTPIAVPKAVRVSKYNIAGGSTNDDYWVFQGGRTITIVVEFDPIPDSVSGGQIQYLKPVAGVIPAKFSMTNEQQTRK